MATLWYLSLVVGVNRHINSPFVVPALELCPPTRCPSCSNRWLLQWVAAPIGGEPDRNRLRTVVGRLLVALKQDSVATLKRLYLQFMHYSGLGSTNLSAPVMARGHLGFDKCLICTWDSSNMVSKEPASRDLQIVIVRSLHHVHVPHCWRATLDFI